jgi:hypothetical protein
MAIDMRPESAERLSRVARRLHLDVDELSVFLDDLASDARSTLPLSSDELDLLADSGVSRGRLDAAAVAVADGSWERRLTRSQFELATQSLTTAQTAAALGLQDASVRRAVMERRLWSFRLGRQHRIPTWQFQIDPTDLAHDEGRVRTRLVEGLPTVVAAIPEGVSAALVQTVMTTPTNDLDPSRPPVSPATWLRLGQPAAAVSGLLQDLDVT